MVIIPKPKKVKLELMSDEIEFLIEEIQRIPHDVYEFMKSDRLIEKLKEALETKPVEVQKR